MLFITISLLVALFYKLCHSFMHIAVADCKKRWKSLRDRYIRVKKELKNSQRSGSAGSMKSVDILTNLMSFLDVHLVTRQ